MRQDGPVMRQAFVFGRVAVLVMPWWEPMDPPERGARVEVRLLDPQTPLGSPSAAPRIVIDTPVFRADLFDHADAEPGNLAAAHFHPRFEGREPCARTWDDAVRTDPTGWLTGQLTDLATVLRGAGLDLDADPSLLADAGPVADAAPAIVAAVEQVWATVRAEPPVGSAGR